MNPRPRVYDAILQRHFTQGRQMAFVSGPRQVGKTTVCRKDAAYLNWDNLDDRRLINAGPRAVVERVSQGPAPASGRRRRLVLDELHKDRRWKTFVKGFFDSYGDDFEIIVTGSSRMDVYIRGGDSLMGRYFPYRMHPFTVAECVRTDCPDAPVRPPMPISEDDWAALWEHGGFPEPFLRREPTITRRWRETRLSQMEGQEIRTLEGLRDYARVEQLLLILQERSACQLNYSELAQGVQVSSPTIKNWIRLLEQLHQGFRLTPWTRSIARSLRKEPKWFLRDWSGVADPGRRAETLLACHLLKAAEGWSDLGFGKFTLHYLRDKRKAEVDFLMARDGEPWMLVEAKVGAGALSPSLVRFQQATGAPHAFQVVLDAPYEAADCFAEVGQARVVPGRTFLSQLL